MASFWRTVVSTLSRPADYAVLSARPFGAAWRYLYGVLLVLCVAGMLALLPAFVGTYRQARAELPTFLDRAKEYFPADLVVTVRGGTLSTNRDAPVRIDPPPYLSARDAAARDPQARRLPLHFLTIDPSGRVDDYESYDTLVLVTSKSFAFPRNGGAGIQVFSLSKVQDLTLDRASYEGYVERAKDLGRLLPWMFVLGYLFALVVAALIVPVVLSLVIMAWLVMMSIATYLIARLFGRRDVGYARGYKLGMYAMTGPLLLAGIANLLPYGPPRFFITVLFLVVVAIVLWQWRSDPQPQPAGEAA